MIPAIRRLVAAVMAVGVVILIGGVSLYALGGGRWELADGLYMAAISAATVGFSELPGFEDVAGARAATVVIILLGIGAFAFFQSSLTAFFVENTIGTAFRRRRMDKAIAKLNGHVVVAGCGSTGRHVVEELYGTRTPFVVIDRDRGHLEQISQEVTKGDMLYIVGDATHDQTLTLAGVERASGVIAALTHDRDNLYVTLSVRTLNAGARIVTKVVELEATPKMLRAGANATVSPNTIGGRRMVSEMIRPTVVEFLDQMFRESERGLRFEEVLVPEGSPLHGRALRELELRQRTNTLVVAVRERREAQISYNPTADQVIHSGMVVIVLGHAEDVIRLRSLVAPAPDRAAVA
jgi:voltage-gated potassium channel